MKWCYTCKSYVPITDENKCMFCDKPIHLKYVCDCGKEFGRQSGIMKHEAEVHIKKIGVE
jgi:hypothetical protein